MKGRKKTNHELNLISCILKIFEFSDVKGDRVWTFLDVVDLSKSFFSDFKASLNQQHFPHRMAVKSSAWSDKEHMIYI